MKLVWTYSDRFKKGKPNKNTVATHEYIQFLFRKAIKEAPSSYQKVVFTDDYNFSLFKDLDVELIPAPKKDFIFLDDLKFDAAEIIDGEFIISDGDLFIKEELFNVHELCMQNTIFFNNKPQFVTLFENESLYLF